ncbi:MAG: hypothetical protein WBJ19_12245 [Rhodoferax sp.]
MQEITWEHSKDITAVLQNLVRDGLLTQQNQRRWASYRVADDSPQLGGDSPQSPANSPQLDRLAGLSPEILNLLPLDQLKVIIQQLRLSHGPGQEYGKQLK